MMEPNTSSSTGNTSSSPSVDPLAPPSTAMDSILETYQQLPTREPVHEFWHDCERCELLPDLKLLYVCEGCRCGVYSSMPGYEYIMVWHGKAVRNGPHELRGRFHTPDSCRQWAADGRDPVTEKRRRDAERAEQASDS